MVLPKSLVEKLACPKCHGALEYASSDERLVCRSCRLAYRITDDIPVLEIDEAEKLN